VAKEEVEYHISKRWHHHRRWDLTSAYYFFMTAPGSWHMTKESAQYLATPTPLEPTIHEFYFKLFGKSDGINSYSTKKWW